MDIKALNLNDRLLKETIEREGAIPIDAFMHFALASKTAGYYRSKQPIGAKGDFITAPEISQLFGEMVAIWFADQLLRSPYHGVDKIIFVECGPGKGTLIRDVLRTFKHITSFPQRLDLHFVEINPFFKKSLQSLSDHHSIHFYEDVSSLETLKGQGPLLILANEFLDVFPISQFILQHGRWHELKLTYDAKHSCFKPIIDPLPCLLPFEVQSDDAYEEGDILEYSKGQEAVIKVFKDLLLHNGGFGLCIDYGYTTCPKKSTLQALYQHQKVNPFQNVGCHDLTSLINFKRMHDYCVAEPSLMSTLINQGDFLNALGIHFRSEQLKSSASVLEKNVIDSALHRLTDPTAMGHLFKVLTLESIGGAYL